jgi:hypothetical protein
MIASTNASKRAATPARVGTTKRQSPARRGKTVRAAQNAQFSVALGSNQQGRELDIAPGNGDSGPHLVVAIYIYQ